MPRKYRAAIFGCFVFVSLLTRGLFLRIPILDIDEAAHIVGSWQVLAGKLLYTDFVDNKPPLLYVYYAVCQLLLGRGMFAVHLLTVLFTVPFTAYAASAFFDHQRKGIFAGLLFLLFSAAFLAHDMLAANAEILMLPAGAWAVVLLRRSRSWTQPLRIAGAGFLIAAGFLFKYQIALWLPAIVLPAALEAMVMGRHKKIAASLILLSTSFVLPLIFTYIYFAYKNGQGELVFWTITNNFGYAANPILFREAIGRAVGSIFPFLIATAPLWWMAWRSLSLYDSPYQLVLIVSLLMFTAPAAFIGFRFYPHYLVQFYFPLAIAAAPAVSEMLTRPLRRPAILFAGCCLLLIGGFTLANAILYFGDARVYRETDPVFANVGKRLQTDACYSGANLFVWGYAPSFYYYAQLRPASRFAVLAQSRLTGYISGNTESVRGKVDTAKQVSEQQWNLLMQDLQRNQPTYIIDTSPAGIYRWNRYPMSDYPRLDGLVRKNYDKLDTVDEVVVYRRKDCRSR